jgi:hypothetical protein
MKALILLIILCPVTWCYADEESCKTAAETPNSADHSWHLLTITYGGTVTLLKDLTRHEAEFARARALGEPATVKECREIAAAEKRRREAEEAELREWKKTAPACPKTFNEFRGMNLESSPGCVDSKGNAHRFFETNTYTLSDRQMKSAEVFQ